MSVKILVVDDEPDLELLIRQKFRRQIRSGTWDFLFAQNGQEALDRLAEHTDVDVILTDINMPVMDGLTLLLRLNELKTLHKAVIVSAYGDLGNIRTAMNRGAFDFVTKPIDFGDLELTLNRTLDQLGLQRRALEEHGQLLSLRQELDIASNIQQSMLPSVFPVPSDEIPIDLFARMTPALEVGGDFYDFFRIGADKMGLAIGDVSGKGVSAAIFMAVTRTLLRATALTNIDASSCISAVNRMLCAENPTSLFVTAFYAILDLKTGEVDACNAGHNVPYVLRAEGGLEPIKGPRNVVLGADDDIEFLPTLVTLRPGDGICLYTDGVSEAENLKSSLFGNERLSATLSEQTKTPSQETIEAIFAAVAEFAGTAPQSDDITALAAKWRPAGAPPPVSAPAKPASPAAPEARDLTSAFVLEAAARAPRAEAAVEGKPAGIAGHANERWIVSLELGLPEVGRVASLLEHFATRHHVPSRITLDMGLALEEILTNIICYGFGVAAEGMEPSSPVDPIAQAEAEAARAEAQIVVTIDLVPERLKIEIADTGRPFNPLERHAPNTALDESDRGIGGLGIHLVRKMMDSVDYRRLDGHWNILTLVRSLHEPPPNTPPP